MEGLSIQCSWAAYNVVVVREYFDDYVGTSPNALFEGKFRLLIVCFRVKDVAVVVNVERRSCRFLVVVLFVFEVGLH